MSWTEYSKSLPFGRLFCLQACKKKSRQMAGQSNRVRRKPATNIITYPNM